MPVLRGGPLHGHNVPLQDPYQTHYPYSADGVYLGAYVLTSVQQKSRVVRHFLWQPDYNRGDSEREHRAERAGTEFLRLRGELLGRP